jgi:hypothetical protein
MAMYAQATASKQSLKRIEEKTKSEQVTVYTRRQWRGARRARGLKI